MKKTGEVTGEILDSRLILKRMGARATPARLALVELMATEEHPLSINAVLKLLSSRKKVTVDYATVFRSLEALVQAGLLSKSDLGHGHAHYEWVHGRKHHHHIVCTSCGLIEEVDSCALESVQKSVLKNASSTFSSIQSHTLDFFGLCNACARRGLASK